MRVPRLTLPLSTFIASLAVACGFPATAAAPPPLTPAATTSATTRWPGVTSATLAAGHDTFVAKCNGCHGYPDLQTVPDDRWPTIMPSMAKKSHISPAEGDDVLHFVLASRASQAAKP